MEEMLAPSNFNQERLLQVLLAPQISEKATLVADKNEASRVLRDLGCHQARSQGCR